MRIVLCSREWSSSTGRYVRSLVRYLEKIDHTNEYIVLLQPNDMDSWQPTNPNFRKVACPHKEYTFDEQLGLKRQLEQLQPDLVHFTMVQQPILYKGLVVTTMQDLTTLRFKNPTKNAVVFAFKQAVYGWVNKVAARKSRLVITPTEFVKNDVVAYTGINPAKIRVTLESADPITDPSEPQNSLKNTLFILYVGRPNPHKNLPRLIEAFSILKQSHPDLKLVIAGKLDDVYKKIQQNIEERGINDVVFTDFIPDGGLRWLYENCQAYAYPSLSEGFGLPALEAMIHGAPVVSSDATCIPEVLGKASHYFNPLDPNDMAKKIAEVLDDKALREKLIRDGKKQAAKYSWERMARQTLDVYNEALQ